MREKSHWSIRRVSFKTFIGRERRISKYTRKGYKYENRLFARCFDLHLSSMGYVYDLISNGITEPFSEAFMKLGIKILYNAEGIRNLINLGLYGSGCTIFRTLVFDTHMVWYLYLNPDLIEEWQREEFNTYKDPNWRSKFSEKTMIANLLDKGKKYRLAINYETDFVFYSKAAHPSCFGVRFFQNENNELAYLPEFSMQMGHLLSIKVLGLLLYPTQVILEKNKSKIQSDSKLTSIYKDYNPLIRTLNSLAQLAVNFHKEILGAIEAKDIIKT